VSESNKFVNSTAILSISLLLKIQNQDGSLEPEIARIYKGDFPQYEATAREWTAKFAEARD
jgi:Ubiquitin-protein ligase